MTPSEYHPVFLEDIPAAWGKDVRPSYCLTDDSAVELQELMAGDKACTIVQLHPMTGGDYEPRVPWCAFGSEPVNINAGQLASFFTHGVNPDTAYQQMLKSIEDNIAAHAR